MANEDVGVCKEAPQRVQVWYDCPEVGPRNKALRMQFAGQVAGVKARVLVDTGLSGCFCLETTLRRTSHRLLLESKQMLYYLTGPLL